jgi:hypothetical protein
MSGPDDLPVLLIFGLAVLAAGAPWLWLVHRHTRAFFAVQARRPAGAAASAAVASGRRQPYDPARKITGSSQDMISPPSTFTVCPVM